MANIVEFLVRLKDMASGPLQKIGQTGASSFNKIQQSMDRLSGRSRTLKQNINDIDAQLAKLERTRNISLDGRQIDRINKQMDELQAKKDKLTNGNRGSGGGIGSFFRTGLSIAGIGSLAFLGKDIMQAGMERQMNLSALQTLLGKNNGTRVNGQLLDFARRSIYGNEVFNEGKLMAGAGIKAGNILPVMNLIGDIALGDKERMKSLALAFSEASTRGNLTGINERMFLQGGLFNPLEQLHKMTGRSMSDLKKDMEKGKISINDLVKAMQYATGPMGRWHDAMKKMQDTPAGKWTAFTGTLRTLAGTIGLALLPVLGKITDFLSWIINNTDILYSVGAAIGAMAAAWALYTLWTERAAIWQGILAVIAYWPLALIGAIAGAITYMCLKYESWGKSMKAIWEIAKDLGIGLVLIFKDSISQVVYFFEYLWLKVKAGFEYVGDLVANLMKALNLAFHFDFSGAKKALTANITTNASLQLDKLSKSNSATHGANVTAIHNIFNAANAAAGQIHFDTKNPKKVGSPMSLLSGMFGGKYGFDGPNGGSTGAADTSKAIAGGGVRNITIIVQKFQDKTEIHATSFKESIQEVERTLEDMFERIVNSAATALN